MASFMSRVACFAAVYYSSMSPVEGNAFLGRSLPHLHMDVDHLLEDLEAVLGAGHREKAEARAASMEDSMRPTFQALPRNTEDLLEPTAVRYLLHRFFVDRHGWFVVGFNTGGDAWDSESAASVFATTGAQDVFEKRMSRGMSLREIALLAATLESLVHAETLQRLHTTYSLLNLSQVENHATEVQARNALDLSMLLYISGLNPESVTKVGSQDMLVRADAFYPMWSETKKWMHEVRKEVLAETPLDRTSFDASVRVVEALADRYGRWQDRECIALKESLLKLERPGTGRVPLSSFYQAALDGAWQFSESKEYLRHLGVLDETDPMRPSVMISNYVNAPTNCVGGSKYYSVCCINECEALLGHLEKTLAAPSASVERIIEVVQGLPSATEDAPRVLSEQLVKRLQEIADHHGGLVPFHARLFNQWLHHAYPRECPYPHLSGTTQPLLQLDFYKVTGQSNVASQEMMEAEIARLGVESDHELQEELLWTADEECFLETKTQKMAQQQQDEASATGSPVRFFMFCMMVCSVVATLKRMLAQATHTETKQKELFV